MLAHRYPEGVERFRRRVVGALILGEGRHFPRRGQRLLGDLRRTVRAPPAHEAGLVLPKVMGPGQDAAVLHPDDLLMDEGAGLLPASLQHRLAARGVPAIPGGVLGDRLGHCGGYEAVVKLRALRTVVPGDAVGLAPILVPRRVVRAVVVHEIRRVGGEQDRTLAVHQTAYILMVRTVAAEQPVIAEDP